METTNKELVRGLIALYNAPTLEAVRALEAFVDLVNNHLIGKVVWCSPEVVVAIERRALLMSGQWTMSEVSHSNSQLIYRFLETYLKTNELCFELDNGGKFYIRSGTRQGMSYFGMAALPDSDEPGEWEYFHMLYIGFMNALCYRLNGTEFGAYQRSPYGEHSVETLMYPPLRR